MSILETNMSSLRANLADALNQASDGDIVLIKRSGKADTALIDGELLEDFLAAASPRFIKKIAQARKEAERGEVVSFEDVYKEIME